MTRPALILACIAGLLVAGCSNSSHEAVAWLRIHRASDDQSAYEAYRNTQVAVIKSPYVLTAALRQPGIAALETIRGEKDQVGWLARHVIVSVPAESEIVQIRLRGDNARGAAQIVNAVTRAYLEHVGGPERTERLAHRDMLEKKYKENMVEVRARLETFNNLARAPGNADLVARRDELAQLQAVTNQMGIQLAAAEVDIGTPGRVELIEEATVRDAP